MTRSQILLAALVPATWGLGFTLAKIGMFQFPPFLLMSMRFAIAAAVLIWFVRPPTGFMGRICMVALVSASAQYGLTFYGLRGLDASTAVIIVQLEAPMLALFATVFLKEKFGWPCALGMALAFAGVAVIAGEPRLEDNLASVALVAAGATIWAVGQIMVSRLKAIKGITLIAYVAAFAAPQMLLASLAIESDHWAIITGASWSDWLIVAYLGLIMTALGYGVWYHLLGTCEVNKLAPFLLLTPVTSVTAGVLMLDETFSTAMAIGALMVLGGVAVTTLLGRQRAIDKPIEPI